eukprot:s692_g19.t1
MPDYNLSADVSAPIGSSLPGASNERDMSKADESDCEPSIQGDIPEDAPVAGQDGEPLEEYRMVPREPGEAVVYVDGTALTADSSLRAAGCESFGLSKRGNKQACLKRMLDHIQTQTLLAALLMALK